MRIQRFTTVVSILFGLFLPVFVSANTGHITSGTSRLCSDSTCSTYTPVSWVTSQGSPVTITDTTVTGSIWSAQLGWINLTTTCGGACSGVHNTTSGVLSGYGWGTTAGFVNFAPSSAPQGVTIDPSTGNFSGWAWVSGGGWMKFDCSLASACVHTDWTPTSSGSTGSTGTTGTNGTGGNNGRGGGGSGSGGGTSGGSGTTGGDSGGTTGGDSGGGATGGDSGGTTGGDSGGGTTGGSGSTSLGGGSSGTSGASGSGGSTGGGGHYIDTGTTGGFFHETPCIPTTATDSLGLIIGQVKNSYCTTTNTFIRTTEKVKQIFNTPQVSTTTATVATVGVVGGASFTIASALFLNPLSFSEIFLIPARLWSLLMAALGLRKRRRPWGTVYDSVTKQPLDPAYVTLKDMEGNEIMSSLTDLDGRFGFVVPQPGTYTIFAHKTNYVFPSQKLVGQDHDELYRDLYFGEYFRVNDAGGVIFKNIPMDPEHFDWNEFAKRQQGLMKFYSKRDKILRRLSNIFFITGFIVAIAAVIFAPKNYNIVVLGFYIVLFFIRRHSSHSRPYGDILEEKTGLPLSFALLRISNIATGVEVMHRIADVQGRYYALLPNGDYNIRIDKKMPDGTYQTVVVAQQAKVTKGYLSQKFKI